MHFENFINAITIKTNVIHGFASIPNHLISFELMKILIEETLRFYLY